MPIEQASTLSQLDDNWPQPTDRRSTADDHIRLIKFVIKSTFPGTLNQGFAKPIIATEDEMNRLSGVTSNIQPSLIPLA